MLASKINEIDFHISFFAASLVKFSKSLFSNIILRIIKRGKLSIFSEKKTADAFAFYHSAKIIYIQNAIFCLFLGLISHIRNENFLGQKYIILSKTYPKQIEISVFEGNRFIEITIIF